MILICDNCHYLFDTDSLQGFSENSENAISESCPLCGAYSITYKINTGDIFEEGIFPAIRRATFNESREYNRVISEARGLNCLDEKSKRSRARIEEAISIINMACNTLSDDEYNMLLIFSLLYGHSKDARIWLKPILGLDRFRPGSRGSSVNSHFDAIRVYENVTDMFRCFVRGSNHSLESLSSDAKYVASFMRQGDAIHVKKTTAGINRAIINSISIESLFESPGKAYLDVIRKIVSLYE